MRVRPSRVFLVLLAGFALRVALIPGPGFPSDITIFEWWGGLMLDLGPHGAYGSPGHPTGIDYPPAYLFVLAVVAWLDRHILGGAPIGSPGFQALEKLPAIVADLGLALVAYALARRVAPGRHPERALFFVALGPPFMLISGYWGQVDSVPALIALGAVWCALERRAVAAWALLGLAIVTKPQSMAFVPFLAVWQWRTRAGPRQVATGLVAAAAVIYFIVVAFTPSPAPAAVFSWLWNRYHFALDKYPHASHGAFNVYMAFFSIFTPDSRRVLGVTLSSWGTWATALVLGAIVVRFAGALRTAGAEQRERLLLSAGFLAYATLFMLLPRMHERYLLPALAFGSVTMLFDRVSALVVGGFAVTFFLNCAMIVAGFYGGHHHPIMSLLARGIALCNVGLYVAVLAHFWGFKWRQGDSN